MFLFIYLDLPDTFFFLSFFFAAFWNLAIAHGRRSNYTEAEKACKHALKVLAKQELQPDEAYNQLVVCVQLTLSTILSDSGRHDEAQKMIDTVLATLKKGKVQQAVVFIRLLARTRFERGLYREAAAYIDRAEKLLDSAEIADAKEKDTLTAYLMCDRLAIIREQGKADEADQLEEELTKLVSKKNLPVPLWQSKYIRVRDALLPRSTGGYRLDIQLRPIVPYTPDGKLHLKPGNHFVIKFQNPAGGEPFVTEHSLTQGDCRKRLLQFRSAETGLAFIPNEAYKAEVFVYDSIEKKELLTRITQLFSRKEKNLPDDQ